MVESFYSNGKLLLTGEYAVLDGALSLAVPTKYGQALSVKEIKVPQLQWKSRDEKGKVWFEGRLDLTEDGFNDNARQKSPETREIRETLIKILGEARKLNSGFLGDGSGYTVETHLTFPRDWGLGSSSTLINNVAQWAEVDAYELQWNAFSGSGYDIACAQIDHPILYRLNNGKPNTTQVDFNPPFKDKLYFVHLNKKQNSRDGIAAYRKKDFVKDRLVQLISEITRKTVSCKSLSEFESLMTEHETLLSKILQMPPVKESLFPSFKGAIKSLGAWGGDFVLATGDKTTPSYFKESGFGTVVPYSEIILEPRG